MSLVQVGGVLGGRDLGVLDAGNYKFNSCS